MRFELKRKRRARWRGRRGASTRCRRARPFLTALAAALLAGDLPAPGGERPDPLELADVTLLLPTRRATRALQEAFLRGVERRARCCCRRSSRSSAGRGRPRPVRRRRGLRGRRCGRAAPRAISEIERQLVLTVLVLRWSQTPSARRAALDGDIAGMRRGASTPAQAARLAEELARLMDMMETENVGSTRLAELVPDDFSEHWERTLSSSRSSPSFWPAHLAEQRLSSPVEQRNRPDARRGGSGCSAAARRRRSSLPASSAAVPAAMELMRRRGRPAERRARAAGARPDARRGELERDRPEPSRASAVRLARSCSTRSASRASDVLPLPGTAPAHRRSRRARR